jgi:hypothetical protein
MVSLFAAVKRATLCFGFGSIRFTPAGAHVSSIKKTEDFKNRRNS